MIHRRIFKRKYESRLIKRATGLQENRRFLLEHFKKEWEEIEKTIERDRRKQKLYETTKAAGTALGFIILGLAAVGGVLIIGAVAPNIFSAFGRFGRVRRYFDRKDFQKKINYFKQRRYIDVTKKGEDDLMKIRLTELGRTRLMKYVLGNLKIILPEKWDGVWRIVIFDIPEWNKWAREGLRQSLKRMGFYPLQKSTFVFPYPCREEIDFLKRLYGVGDHLRLIETSTISFDDDLRAFFGLK